MSTTYIKRSSEDTEQEVVIQWARFSSGKWPELKLLHHIPNGGSRNKKEAVKLKHMGVLAGVADLHLPAAAAEDNYCIVCYSAADAIEAIATYLEENPRYNNLSVISHGRVVGKIQ